jgi:hypothetical protein
MSIASMPSDEELRQFLLGALPEDRVDSVRAWLDRDPAHAARLAGLAVQNEFAARREDLPDAPEDVVERIVRKVAAAGADTPDASDETGTSEQDDAPALAAAWPAAEGGLPARLGEYRVVREIGRGGMGVVLEVSHDVLDRPAAAKVLKPELVRQPTAIARFLREARAAAAVEHDHVVPIWHVGAESGAPYIVMPLLKGEPLDRRLKRQGALPAAEVVRIGGEIAAGLEAAHARGLIHRDMKPANVWLDETAGRARVLDFGLARLENGADALTQTDSLQGTPAYMAPELLDGRPADVRSDLFALGAILYECATGRRAFTGATITAVLKAVASHNPVPPAALNPSIPVGLSALVMKLLNKDPANRPPTAAEVVHALNSLSRSQADQATDPWIEQPARKASKARRTAGLLAAGVGLLAASAGGVWLAARPWRTEAAHGPPSAPLAGNPDGSRTRYRGKVDVLVERVVDGAPKLLRLDEPGALPMSGDDRFRIEGEVDPPGYLYLVWVDPNHDVTPCYPWDPEAERWQGTRPPDEAPTDKVSLPRTKSDRWRAPKARAGVATVVLFARPTPLDAADEAVEHWFKVLPDLPSPPGGEESAVWFDDYAIVKTDPLRRAQFVREATSDPFEEWQGRLQRSLTGKAQFQTAVSFARTGRK